MAMLDLLEWLGFDLVSLDGGRSVRWQQSLWPGTRPQSVCSHLVERGWWPVVVVIGYFHCRDSFRRHR